MVMLDSPRSPSSPSSPDGVEAAVQRVYKLPKSSKRRYSLVSLDSNYLQEDVVISPKTSSLNLLHALDYFQEAASANQRLARFKATQEERFAKVKAKGGRAKSLEPVSNRALDKFRAAADKVVIANTFRHPMMSTGMGYSENFGKVNDLKERLLRSSQKSLSI